MDCNIAIDDGRHGEAITVPPGHAVVSSRHKINFVDRSDNCNAMFESSLSSTKIMQVLE